MRKAFELCDLVVETIAEREVCIILSDTRVNYTSDLFATHFSHVSRFVNPRRCHVIGLNAVIIARRSIQHVSNIR